MTAVNPPLDPILRRYREYLVVHGEKKFPLAKARLLTALQIGILLIGFSICIAILEYFHYNHIKNFRVLTFSGATIVGIIAYLFFLTNAGVQRYWRAYRAVQAFTDHRPPVLYLRGFRGDDIAEKRDPWSVENSLFYAFGDLHGWITGSPNPVTRYSVEEDIAPVFRKVGPLFEYRCRFS